VTRESFKKKQLFLNFMIKEAFVNFWNEHIAVKPISDLVIQYMQLKKQSAQIGGTDVGLTREIGRLEKHLRVRKSRLADIRVRVPDESDSTHKYKDVGIDEIRKYGFGINTRTTDYDIIGIALSGKPPEEVYQAMKGMGYNVER